MIKKIILFKQYLLKVQNLYNKNKGWGKKKNSELYLKILKKNIIKRSDKNDKISSNS